MSDILTEEELLALINEESEEEEEAEILSEDELLALLADDDVLTEEQILSLLAEAPDDDIPQVGNFEEYAASNTAHKRAGLEQQQAHANAVQSDMADRLEFAEKPAHERAYASGMEGVQTAIQMPAMVANAPSAIGRIMGFDTPDIIPTNIQHTPEGSAAQSMGRMGGEALSVGMGFVPVARASGAAGSVVADIMGLGASTDDLGRVIANQAARNAKHLPPKSQELDNTVLTEIDLNNGEQLLDVAAKAQDEVNEMRYAAEFNEMDVIDSTLEQRKARNQEKFDLSDGTKKDAKKQKKADRRAAREAEESHREVEAKARAGKQSPYGGAIEFGNQWDEGVIKHMARRFEVDEKELTQALIREGGIPQPATLRESRARRYAAEAEDMYSTTGHSKLAWDGSEEVAFGWYNEVARPATALLRENVGAGFSAQVERSYIESASKGAELTGKYQGVVDEFRGAVQWAETPEVKRMFMNLFKTGVEGRAKLLQKARAELTAEQYEVFDEFIEDAYVYQKDMGGLFHADEILDQVHAGMNKMSNKGPRGTTKESMRKGELPNGQGTDRVDAVQGRDRGDASKMGAGELAMYENPMMAMFTRMTQDQDIIALAKNLKIPPHMLVGDDVGAITGAIFKHVEAVTGSSDKAAAASRIIGDLIAGTRKRPNQFIRTFMNQAYGVSLGQFDSALLNTHDIFNSMNHQGVVPTISALLDQLRGKGIDPKDFGITDASIGEFKEGMGLALIKPKTAGDKAENIAAKYSEKAFSWSQFKALDLGGKGVIMRATLNDMQRLAQTPKGMQALRKKYGHLLSDRELGEVAKVLRDKRKITEVSQRQRDILGSAMVGRLAEQQLVSQASRPLNYLRHPALRPIWMMSGFAIRQADRLKQQVYDEVVAGNHVAAGEAFGRFLFFNVGGFIIVDSVRDIPSAMMGNEHKEITPENTGVRAIEAVAGPLTMNKVGSPRDAMQLYNEGTTAYLGDKLMPADGSLGVAEGTIRHLIEGNIERAAAELTNVFPGYGRFMSDLWEMTIDEAEANDPIFQAEKRREAAEKRREKRLESIN